MTASYASGRVVVHHGDCFEVLAGMADCSVDAVVTDPPAGIAFMGKHWDGDKGGRDAWIAWLSSVLVECLRVMKPGGHAFVWALPRTSGWTHRALEDAGWEIRDCVSHLFGSGFPKSHDVSKAIDRIMGAEREVVGVHRRHGGGSAESGSMAGPLGTASELPLTAPATPEAAKWQGFGTALKPASEHWWLARKPLAGSVAGNVLAWGTGGLNVDACRIETDGVVQASASGGQPFGPGAYELGEGRRVSLAAGRWPANVVLDEAAAVELDRQSGETTSAVRTPTGRDTRGIPNGSTPVTRFADTIERGHGDSGGASRFLYVAKADASERPRVNGTSHPTVKPLSLLRWLVRLVTPPDGLVLDPFAGSGTTGEAALLEGFRAVLVEREAEYLPLIEARLHRRTDPVAWVNAHRDPDGEPDLFSALS